MEKKLAEYKCDTNEAISLKVGMCYLLPSYYCDPLKKTKNISHNVLLKLR